MTLPGADGAEPSEPDRDGAAPAEPATAEPAADPAAEPGEAARGVRQLTAADFSLADSIGGVRGLIESVAPGFVFVVVYIVTRELMPPLVAALAVAVVLLVARLLARTPITQAISGLFGVGIGVVWAWRTGEAGDYYVFGLWTNAVYLVALLVSILLRWPAVGIVVSLLRQEGFGWRHEPLLRPLRRRYDLATWLWVALFAVRLAVQLPLYLDGDQVAWLGTARLVMGLPLWALTLWVTWMLVRLPGGSRAEAATADDADGATDHREPRSDRL